MSDQHYFTPDPTSQYRTRQIEVELAGRHVEVTTAGGMFSPDHLDKGTEVLLREAPAPPGHGTFLDLGCGWGPIAMSLALRSPAAQVYAVDVNSRALELTAHNAAALGLEQIRTATPEALDPALRFDLIWSNPPIRVGKAVLHEILRTWLPRLAPGGQAWLVVQKNLGSDSLQRWIASQFGPELSVDRPATSKGFRLLRVSRESDVG